MDPEALLRLLLLFAVLFLPVIVRGARRSPARRRPESPRPSAPRPTLEEWLESLRRDTAGEAPSPPKPPPPPAPHPPAPPRSAPTPPPVETSQDRAEEILVAPVVAQSEESSAPFRGGIEVGAPMRKSNITSRTRAPRAGSRRRRDRSNFDLRRAVVYREILDQPVSMRRERVT